MPIPDARRVSEKTRGRSRRAQSPMKTPVPSSGWVTREPAVRSGDPYDMKTTDVLRAFDDQLVDAVASCGSIPDGPCQTQLGVPVRPFPKYTKSSDSLS